MLERWVSYTEIRYETDRHSKLHHMLSIPFAELLLLTSRAEIRGILPKQGPAIVAANHTSGLDPFLLHLLAIVKAERTISSFARRSMLQEGVVDSMEAHARRTQKDEKGLKWKLRQWYLSGFNPIPVDIRNVSAESSRVNLAAFKKATEELREGRMVGIFPQGTRKPELDLLDNLEGIILLGKKNPDVPIYPVGFNGTDKGVFAKFRIHIGQPFTFKEMSGEASSDFIARRMAEQITDPSLKSAWRLNHEFGWSRDDVRKSKGVYHQIGETADLLEQIAKTDLDFVRLPQPEIDRQIQATGSLIE